MPPKKKPNEPSKKAEAKKKEKIIEDKTFGLKNKKGAKNQKYIQQVQKQVTYGNQSARKAADVKPPEKSKDKKKEMDELNQLFRPVTTQKVEKGVDPKSVLCAFYKQGHCGKGDKCKFSHDVTVERKSEKRNVYYDSRDNEGDTMENWDEAKLKEVVEKKHGEAEKKLPKTDIICKYFLEALENNKYGWFWECPNGGDKCHYRHALPPGFVLNKDKKKQEKKEEISIEDLVEIQRAKLGGTLTKITLQTFMAWKKKKMKEKEEKVKKEQDRKRAEFKAGRHIGLSGRDMFTFRPEFAEEDQMEEGEATFDLPKHEEEEDQELIQGPCKEITLELLAAAAEESDNTGTVLASRHWANQINGDGELDEAAGGSQDATDSADDAVPIDENLFDEDDEDLAELEEKLETLSTD